ncbi:branched-chain amino acid ABC transporter permease [Nocardioides sp. zg-ZUI104]|uniref:branched-chain amino acid ABC transporter permease n=1 Tax=Nocardioides faecalis TaxID=2803858 RepID=UPI001BD160DC|nr:branched-chain amino acid ABC transporter permease [Nocardioides faecalis]MBS4751943.1 branched-chain amino acid ABC transporter permease [Nocardioides faecalis]
MTNLQLWLSAIEIGCFFALIALGYLLVVVGADFFNFALGPFAMVGGLGTSWLVLEQEVPLWPAVALGLLMVLALSAVTELAVVRPVQRRSGRGELPALVAVAAVLFAVQQGAGLIFGRLSLPGQRLLDIDPIEVGDAFLQPGALLLVAAAVVVFVAVGGFLRFTRTGRLLRAVGDNREAAAVLGLPVGRVRLVAFLLGGLIAGIAGILYASKSGVAFTSGLGWTLTGFLALVIGGTGRVWAPLVGGLVLGVVQVFTPYYISEIGPETVILVLALLFFAFRPEGLFVRKVRA